MKLRETPRMLAPRVQIWRLHCDKGFMVRGLGLEAKFQDMPKD